MMPGVRGRLISPSFAVTQLPEVAGAGTPPERFVREIETWSERRDDSFGPTSSVRAVTDGVVIPLLRILGLSPTRRVDREASTLVETAWCGAPSIPVVVVGWGESLDAAWRTSVLDAIRLDARWCVCSNGVEWRVVDAHRTWSRHYIEFDLGLLAHEPEARALLWRIGRGESITQAPSLLERVVNLSDGYGTEVCRALGAGVIEALELVLNGFGAKARRLAPPERLFEQSLTVLYRVLFLLFAEARGLVPMWHPVYRDRYTIESIVTTLLAGRPYRGAWLAIRAISLMAHAGCDAGELRATAFNGRLFSPEGVDVLDKQGINDGVMARAVMAVSTTPPARGRARRRIAYGELDVEELGLVYERVLARDLRKATGTFYTPRSLTAHLVRETLAPLVVDRTADQILGLRILDPAMGSGAFLVAACAQLAEAAEEALIREGRWHRVEVTAVDRMMLRREVAQRCLFGVDINPTAVQVARLSLWLTTLAADRPLTFLDHHLVTGNSLVGASIDDVRRRPPGRRSAGAPTDLPLFDDMDLASVLKRAVDTRLRVTRQADESVATVHSKERALASLHARDGPLGRWAQVLDLWCAGWFWERPSPPDRGVFGALVDLLLHRRSSLPTHTAAPLLDAAQAAAARHRFLHWPVAFPEVFSDERGEPLPDPGFDAIVGNPPWDMVRGDSGDEPVRDVRRQEARGLARFARESGIYRIDSRGHVNVYQLFVERAIQLTRRRGRFGLVLPGGVLTDTGSGPLRRYVFDHAQIDRVTGLSNRNGVFPVHRSVRFALLTCTTGERTGSVRCQFGLDRAEQLDDVCKPGPADPATGQGAAAHPVLTLTRAFLSRLSGEDDLAIPDVRSPADVRILEGTSARIPHLCSPGGWNVSFGRELNATDDRGLFVPFRPDGPGRRVIGGKEIGPFRTSLDGCQHQLAADANVRIPRRPRLAYRDVASASNRLTLIAAIVPADVVTTHTLFCLRTPLPIDAQHVLCALLNSFVANYLVRVRVNTHVTIQLVSRLPVPRPDERGRDFARLAGLARALMQASSGAEDQPEYVELQAIAARLYGLSEADFTHVLSTFPLMPDDVKAQCLTRFNGVR